jgi:Na+-translocating ferredoxin:NAD+ oxidoreductase RnfD subunit
MTPTLSAPVAPRKFQIDSRYVAPLLISAILLAGHFQYGILEQPQKTALAIVTSILCELLFGLLFTRKVPHLASAYVSGISCGILIRSPEWWPYVVVAALSTISKYVIRVNGRHLWNPSNLGIVLLLIFAHESVSTLSFQWGNHPWAGLVIWALGFVIVSRLKRLHICLTYIGFFVFYAWLRTFFTRDPFEKEVAPITGPMYQLFILFMITDPKTTVHSRKGQMLVAFLVATVECIFRLIGGRLGIHAPYYALTLMGPSANLLEIFWQRYVQGRPSAPAPA